MIQIKMSPETVRVAWTVTVYSDYIMFSSVPSILQHRDEKKYERLREFSHWIMDVLFPSDDAAAMFAQ